MSMVCEIRSLRDETIDRLLAEPTLVWRLIAPDDPDIYYDAIGVAIYPLKLGCLGRLLRKPPPPPGKRPPLPEVPLQPDENQICDLDKTWHGLHHLLSGGSFEDSTFPEGWIVEHGQPVGDLDLGYGPARVFHAEQAAAIARLLEDTPPEILAARFDPEKMDRLQIYPDAWQRDDHALPWLLETYRPLRSFTAATRDRGHGLMVVLQ